MSIKHYVSRSGLKIDRLKNVIRIASGQRIYLKLLINMENKTIQWMFAKI